MENLKLCAHLFASLIGSLASLHSRFARVVEQAFSGKLRCTRFPKSFNVGKQLKRLRQMPYVIRNFYFRHLTKNLLKIYINYIDIWIEKLFSTSPQALTGLSQKKMEI